MAGNEGALMRMNTMQRQVTHDAVVGSLKAELMQQKLQIEAKLEMLAKLEGKTEQQQLNLLFSLWDLDGDGLLSVAELALGIKRALTTLEPSLDEMTEKNELLEFAMDAASIAMINFGQGDEEPRIKKEDFATVIKALCSKINVPFMIISEALVLSYVGASAEEQITEAVEFLALKLVEGEAEQEIAVEKKFRDILENETMQHLFKKFDRDQDMSISFKELALGLDKLRAGEMTFGDSIEAALNALLLFDEGNTRTLNYVQFARFILTFCAAAGAPFAAVGPKLLEMEIGAPEEPEELRKLKSALLTDITRDMNHLDKVVNTVQDVRCELLFQMFDTDGSGDVSFQELAIGLRSFNPSSSLSDSAAVAASMMLAFDADENNTLNRMEFADFLNSFCETIGADFDELADYLVVARAVQDSSSERDIALLESIQPAILADIHKTRAQLEG
ncbi:hypothetical protein FVE85_5332 [Porphyridium purpureum]|uniref:EF-hand domain-containing protein n=1 Tax=Porphyridium purpureum TaxID=35688 RepID=A0A5J4Z566_PORPP|nr:hypothetical protein FVE85_5332 [Porphyridium purpureum]|eukprot:POR1865..scf295_1